ncbi:MAG: glycine--tRNA ligase, partial [Nitrososphaerales archaeon]|nr:glycine--tRNA ligase [Nitrososphaerales archaeon]
MNYEEVLRLSLERGFFMPSCEIYSDAPAGFWDYGPLGVNLRNRFIELWRRELVRRDGMIEIDGAQIMPKSVFVASGHLKSFADPIVSCKKCNTILRVDRFIAENLGKIIPERLVDEEFDKLIDQYGLRCPNCNGEFSKTRRFNMMFKLGIGPAEDEAYLRPETCQTIFTDFPRLFRVMRGKLPLGFAQFGKSFRNEISPRQSLIRLREFYQAEIEVFFNPKKADDFEKFDEVRDYQLRLFKDGEVKKITCQEALEDNLTPNKLITYYLALIQQFYDKTGIDMERSRFRALSEDERAFYAEVAYDFEVNTSLGWIELVACNYRTDYDLKGHSKISGKDMRVMDDGEKIIPHVFELSMGVDRSIYCILEHNLKKDGERLLLSLKPYLAPIQVSVFPLVNRDSLPEKAKSIYRMIKSEFDAFYDDSGSIG